MRIYCRTVVHTEVKLLHSIVVGFGYDSIRITLFKGWTKDTNVVKSMHICEQVICATSEQSGHRLDSRKFMQIDNFFSGWKKTFCTRPAPNVFSAFLFLIYLIKFISTL